jgi:plastocyanin
VKGGTTSGTATQTVKLVSDPTTVGAFDPKTVTVKVGQTLEWDFQDPTNQHTVTADDGSFDSGTCGQGAKFFVTFNKAGSIPYHCTLHSQMVGTITVGS